MRTLALLLALAPLSLAQQLDLSFLDRLSEKTDEVVNITLDENLLKMGAGLLSNDKDSDARDVKAAVDGLKQIIVRSYTFKQPGDYTSADLDKIYAQIKGQGWSQIVETREKNERTTIHIKQGQNGPGGMVIVTASPKELSVVSLVGSIDLAKLGRLGGNLGIPNIGHKDSSDKTPKPPAKDDEED